MTYYMWLQNVRSRNIEMSNQKLYCTPSYYRINELFPCNQLELRLWFCGLNSCFGDRSSSPNRADCSADFINPLIVFIKLLRFLSFIPGITFTVKLMYICKQSVFSKLRMLLNTCSKLITLLKFSLFIDEIVKKLAFTLIATFWTFIITSKCGRIYQDRSKVIMEKEPNMEICFIFVYILILSLFKSILEKHLKSENCTDFYHPNVQGLIYK